MDGAVILIVIAVVVLVGVFIFWRGRANTKIRSDEGLQTIAEADRMTRPAPASATAPSISAENNAPNMMASLEIVDGPNAIVQGRDVGKQVYFGKTRLTIGRSGRQADFQLYSLEEPSSVSRLHCTIEFNPGLGCFMIIDEG